MLFIILNIDFIIKSNINPFFSKNKKPENQYSLKDS